MSLDPDHYREPVEVLLEDAEQALVDLQEQCCGSCEFEIGEDGCSCTILWASINEIRRLRDE